MDWTCSIQGDMTAWKPGYTRIRYERKTLCFILRTWSVRRKLNSYDSRQRTVTVSGKNVGYRQGGGFLQYLAE
jgi:hypothetical protein